MCLGFFRVVVGCLSTLKIDNPVEWRMAAVHEKGNLFLEKITKINPSP